MNPQSRRRRADWRTPPTSSRGALARGQHRPRRLPRPARDPARQGRPDRRARAALSPSGLGFCWAVMGTDLRHTPVVGGEQGYPDMVARPDLSTLRRAAVGARRRLLSRRPRARRGAGADRPARPRAPRRGRARRARPHREDRARARVLPARARRRGRLAPPRRQPEHGLHRRPAGRSAGRRPRRCSRRCAALGLGAIAGNHEYMNSQYEINLREATPLAAADNAFRFKAAVKDYAAQRGLLRDLHGQAVQRPGRLRHPPAHLARARGLELHAATRATRPGSPASCATSSAACSRTRRR